MYLGDDREDARAFKAIPDNGWSVPVRGNFIRPWPISGFSLRMKSVNSSSADNRPARVILKTALAADERRSTQMKHVFETPRPFTLLADWRIPAAH
ncbi:MAG TPA: hypothetical protein VJ437_06335 [Acidiferrobacterales bacterium]|nr:hypothetical protein [Acidiferrobacterales bacterium]